VKKWDAWKARFGIESSSGISICATLGRERPFLILMILENMTTGHYILKMRKRISRENILKVGMELIHGLGYNGVSVGDITTKVGIPKGSFYNHFHSKQEFLGHVIDMYASESQALVVKNLMAVGVPPLEKLRNYFAEATQYYGADPTRLNGCLIGNICQELASVDAGIRKKLEKNFRGSDELLAEVLKEGVRKGALPREMDIPPMVQFITNGWQGALLRMKSAGNRRPLEMFQAVLFGSILIKGAVIKTVPK
jgi:TetR/AcrR family transcriptional regulator, transcriptional repressor for nem operon